MQVYSRGDGRRVGEGEDNEGAGDARRDVPAPQRAGRAGRHAAGAARQGPREPGHHRPAAEGNYITKSYTHRVSLLNHIFM